MYSDNPDGITWRVRNVFAAAGFRDEEVESAELRVESENGASAVVETMAERDSAVAHRGEIHAERKGGLRQASVRDFHSFRVTWVTLALTAGVPLELVQKVTGHKTTDIVLKHYSQPGREDFRRALQSAMPKLLTNGHRPSRRGYGEAGKSPKDEMRAFLERMTAKDLKHSKARLLALLGETPTSDVSCAVSESN